MVNNNQSTITTNQGGRTTMPNVTNNNFQEKFETGKLAEYLFYYLHGKGTIALVDDEYSRKTDTDFLVDKRQEGCKHNYDSTEEFVRCEVKLDERCHRTGNLFLEFKTERKNSREWGWIGTSRADELWYFDVKNKLFYVFDLPKLRYYFFYVMVNHLRDDNIKDFDDYIDKSKKWGLIYNIELDEAHALKKKVEIKEEEFQEACNSFIATKNKKERSRITKKVGNEIVRNHHGKADTYKGCIGIPEIDNYIATHRDLPFVKRWLEDYKRRAKQNGIRTYS